MYMVPPCLYPHHSFLPGHWTLGLCDVDGDPHEVSGHIPDDLESSVCLPSRIQLQTWWYVAGQRIVRLQIERSVTAFSLVFSALTHAREWMFSPSLPHLPPSPSDLLVVAGGLSAVRRRWSLVLAHVSAVLCQLTLYANFVVSSNNLSAVLFLLVVLLSPRLCVTANWKTVCEVVGHFFL